MITLRQLPAIVDIEFVRGDSFATDLNFDPSTIVVDGVDMDLSGYTFSAPIHEETRVVSPHNPNGAPIDGDFIYNFTITNVDLPTGRLSISLQGYETMALLPDVPYRWHLKFTYPNNFLRTMISGRIRVQ